MARAAIGLSYLILLPSCLCGFSDGLRVFWPCCFCKNNAVIRQNTLRILQNAVYYFKDVPKTNTLPKAHHRTESYL